jgi:telomerase reverse transcriptase
VIWQLFVRAARSGTRAQHLLCQGYRKNISSCSINRNENAPSAIPGITSVYPNIHVTAMKGSPWTQVLSLMGKEGEKIMIDLILNCGIFVAVESGKGNYHQLSGKLSQLFSLEILTQQRYTNWRPLHLTADHLPLSV